MFIEVNLKGLKNLLPTSQRQSDSRKNGSIENVLSKLDWRNFESTVAQIFSVNGFSVVKNLRFKTDRRYEVDLVAYNQRVVSNHIDVFCVDCKRWGTGRYKKSALFRAADEQRKRTKEFEKFISSFKRRGDNNNRSDNRNSSASDLDGLFPSHKLAFHPTIVTLYDELVSKEECPSGVLIIPVWKLNSFLNSAHF